MPFHESCTHLGLCTSQNCDKEPFPLAYPGKVLKADPEPPEARIRELKRHKISEELQRTVDELEPGRFRSGFEAAVRLARVLEEIYL